MPFQGYLLEHWQNGRRTGRQLWLDIRALGLATGGCTGSHSVVATFMAQVRKARGLAAQVRTDLHGSVAGPTVTPRPAAWLVLARPDQRDVHDLHLRSALPGRHPDRQLAAEIAQRFAQLVPDRSPDAFDDWLQHSLQSTLSAIRSVARSIQPDDAAVKAALTTPGSNAMLEGHVNRLKFVQRQRFGTAQFDLLCLPVLA